MFVYFCYSSEAISSNETLDRSKAVKPKEKENETPTLDPNIWNDQNGMAEVKAMSHHEL